MSARLSAIAESLPKGAVVCDVGSDHGQLPLFLLRNGICTSAIVTDLNEKPLRRAFQNFREAGLEHDASFVLTDGILEVLPLQPDAFVIAGMGGETILGILQRGLGQIRRGTVFLLQPMTKIADLRRFLYEFGFEIQQEKLVYENEKYFIIIRAVFDGISRVRSADVFDYGEHIIHERSKIVRDYFTLKLSSVENIIKGKEKAGLSCETENKQKALLLKILEDIDEDRRD